MQCFQCEFDSKTSEDDIVNINLQFADVRLVFKKLHPFLPSKLRAGIAY